MIDNIIVFGYLVATLLVGIYYRSKSNNFRSFSSIKGNFSKSKLLLVATIFVSAVGGGTVFGITEKVFSGHISYSYGLLTTIIANILLAIFIVPKLAKHYGAESVGDIMEKYYGRVGRLIAGLSSVIVSFGFIAVQINISGRIFQYILGIDHITGILISYAIVIAYTTIGGLRSILFTHIIQFFAMVVTVPILSIVNVQAIDFADLWRAVGESRVLIGYDSDLMIETISLSLGFCVMGMYPSFIQRTLINSDGRQTASAIYMKSAIFLVFLFFITLNGLIAFYLFPEQVPQLALPYLVDMTIPRGLQGIIVVGLLATVMSSAEADLNIASISLVKDILVPICNIRKQQRLLLIARIMNILIGSMAIFMALSFSSIVDLVIFIAGLWVPIVVIPLIFALYNIIIPKKALAVCSFLNLLSFMVWEIYFAHQVPLKGVFVSTLFSAAILLLAYRMLRIYIPRANE
jgi:Na+/proline symporter